MIPEYLKPDSFVGEIIRAGKKIEPRVLAQLFEKRARRKSKLVVQMRKFFRELVDIHGRRVRGKIVDYEAFGEVVATVMHMSRTIQIEDELLDDIGLVMLDQNETAMDIVRDAMDKIDKRMLKNILDMEMTKEKYRADLLSTGTFSPSIDGVSVEFDYGISSGTVDASWGTSSTNLPKSFEKMCVDFIEGNSNDLPPTDVVIGHDTLLTYLYTNDDFQSIYTSQNAGVIKPTDVQKAVNHISGGRNITWHIHNDSYSVISGDTETKTYMWPTAKLTLLRRKTALGEPVLVEATQKTLDAPQGGLGGGVKMLHNPTRYEGFVSDSFTLICQDGELVMPFSLTG